MVAVEEPLARFLHGASERHVAQFVASCVERGAGVFFQAIAGIDERTADADTFLELLDDLWQGRALPLQTRLHHQERVDAFPEMQGDEEPPGILAFAYDAVAAMYYAYSYLATGGVQDVTYCSNHMLNSAGFVDDVAGTGDLHYEGEVAAQLRDIEILLGSDIQSSDDALKREQSQGLGRLRVDALRAAFP